MERGIWPATDVLLHISVKERIVLRIFLEVFFPSISRPVKVIRWEVDNTTALAYVKKEGGTSSLPLLQFASEVLLLADSFQIKILPVYVPSE